VIKHDPAGVFKFASLQSGAGQQLLSTYGLQQTDFNSFVLIEDDKAFTKSEAALMVAKKLNGPVKLLVALFLYLLLSGIGFTISLHGIVINGLGKKTVVCYRLRLSNQDF
jgi:predicted DCC family thiol-disulfide oxidoreductase YuxK